MAVGRSPPNRAAVGRADLLRLLGAAGEAGLAAMADLAGFEWRPAAAPPPQRQRAPEDLPAAGPVAAAVSPGAVTGVTLYRVTAWESIPRSTAVGERPAWWHQARRLPPGTPRAVGPFTPAPEPLLPWRRLWPFLRAALGQTRDDRAVDLERMVELAARGQVPRRLPRRRHQHWAPAARVILDFSPYLEPFHADLAALIRPLTRLRGPLGLQVLATTEGPAGPFIERLDARRFRTLPSVRRWDAQHPVLVVGDFGCYADPDRRAAWGALGAQLRRAGVRPVALLPCPPRYWDPDLTRAYRPFTWDRRHRLPARIGTPRAAPAVPANPAEDPGARRLLDLLAPAIRVEPALLRALRHRLGAPGMDVGAEAAAWFHADLEHRAGAAEWSDRDRWEARRAAFGGYPVAERRLAGHLLLEHHRHLPGSVGAAETVNLGQLLGADAGADLRELVADAAAYRAATLRTLEETGDPDQARRLRQYAGRLGERQPADAWQDDRQAALWVQAHRDDLLAGTCALPPGLKLSAVDWVLADAARPRVWTLIQQGEALVLMLNPPLFDALGPGADPGIDPADPIPASPLAYLRQTETPVQYAPLDERQRQSSAPPGVQGRIPLTGAGIILHAYDAVLTIEPLTKPAWAQAIGRDGSGLYVDLAQGEGTRRLRWVSPGEALGLETAMEIRDLPIPRAAFWDEPDYRDWRHGELARPGWAQRIGRDEHGLWAEFVFKGITQRMRWVWPGEFTMGSPDNEPERSDDERQHQVLLTRGLWLADTACTQALWEAVMGENPSRFKGAERPVEQVDWEQVQAFIARLNAAVPGLGLRLPTESEWEYGCRAGTATPFSFGETITTDQVNYDGDFPYGDGPKGIDRSQTVEVKALPCNAWGLYQMHGNVWEWCQDWYGDYPEGTTIDPPGAPGVWRVLRGGSWAIVALLLRSAFRSHVDPGSRLHFAGFRLALGPSGRPAEPGSGEAEPGERGAGLTPWSGVGQVLRGAWRKVLKR